MGAQASEVGACVARHAAHLKLTDSQAGSFPEMHALHALRYRAFAFYGHCGPGSTARPTKLEHFDSLEWADPLRAGVTAGGV